MSVYPPALERLISALSRLPGIGPKTATRLALFILKDKRGLARDLAAALTRVKAEVHPCPVCFNLTDQETCPLCADPGRDPSLICVVQGPAEVAAVERAGSFKGRYHVLGGLLSPLDNVGPTDLRVRELLRRTEDGQVQEVILATSPTTQGQATATYLSGLLRVKGVKVSRIAFGLPLGSDLEYADPDSLKASLEGRTKA